MPAGYECTFVEDVPEDYICCICRCAMRSPVQTKCGHRFCKFCLNSSLKSLNRCPVDRVNLSAQDMFNDKATERKILSFKIKCVNQGCEWQGELRNLMAHKKECQMAVVSCTYQTFGCNFKGERKTISEHIITKHLAFTTGKLMELQTENATLKRKFAELESQNEVLKVRIIEANSLLWTKQDKNHVKYVWKIKDFNIKLQNAKEKNMNTFLSSGPFYTDKYGYKMRLKLYPNGDGLGKGSHVSLFLIVMRGDYDGILSWPFNYKVKLTLVDQKPDKSKRNNIKWSFSPDDSTVDESFVRPTTGENTGYGFMTFVSHEALFTENYLNIVDGSIFIQLDIKTC